MKSESALARFPEAQLDQDPWPGDPDDPETQALWAELGWMEAHPFTTRVSNAALTYLPRLTPGLRSSSAYLILSLAIRRLGDAHDRALDQATTSLPPRDLAAVLKLSRQTVHQNCKRLVEAGWLETPCPGVYRAGFLLHAVIDIARAAGPSRPWWEE